MVTQPTSMAGSGETSARPSWPDVGEMLRQLAPANPVYCIFPHAYRESTQAFLEGFPGRVLYAVKANNHPAVVELLIDSGVCHFDCASLAEVALVDGLDPEAKKYFMVPTRVRGEAAAAQQRHGVRHFMVDHAAGVPLLAAEIDMPASVVFVRMAVHHASAMADLSVRFGAPPEDVPEILERVRETGAEPALAFNVGSSVLDPDAYRYAMGISRDVLESLAFDIRLLDIGGGYPKSYPGFQVPGLDLYFRAVRESMADMPLAANAEVLGEPGRALASPGMSAVVEVVLRKEDRLYINDGMYGMFWELRFEGHDGYPVRAFRDGRPHEGETMPFIVNGPTCDSSDTLPGKVELPKDIRVGDHLEFGQIGAYSLSGRTDFNGYYSDHIVAITNEDEYPPGHED